MRKQLKLFYGYVRSCGLKSRHRVLLIWCLSLLLAGHICQQPASTGKAAAYGDLQTLSDRDLIDSIRIYQCTKDELDRLLPELHRRFPGYSQRLRAVAALYAGAPYCTDPLQDEKENFLPYARTNCTLFVLYLTAFAAGRSYQ